MQGRPTEVHIGAGSERARWPSLHVYGASAALTWETDVNRQEQPTLRVEAATAGQGRQYDWGNKIVLQLTPRELVHVAAVLVGAARACEFNNRGDNGEKALTVCRQDESDTDMRFFVRVAARGQRPRAVPMGCADALWVAGLATSQLRAIYPWMAAADVERLLYGVFRL